MKSLLLLVDLKRAYLASPGLEPAAGSVVQRAATLLGGCRELGIPVVHAWTTVSRSDDRRMPHWKRDDRWLCEEGTPGHEPPPELLPEPAEQVLHKTFFTAFEGGELDRLLEAEGSERLLLAGVHLHGCVRQAVLDAYQRHPMELWVAEDATASNDPVHAAITRRYLERRAARFASVGEIVAGLARPDAPAQDGDAAIAAVRRCRAELDGWQAGSASERAAALERIADRIEPAAGDLALAMADEIGKPVRYGEPEVVRTAEMLRVVARRAVADDGGGRAGGAAVRRRPLGVVAVVTPWNHPVYIPLGKIGPALAYGNAVVWKPAPVAQSIAERVAGLLDGLPLELPGG